MWPQITIVDVENNNLSGNILTSMGVPKSLLNYVENERQQFWRENFFFLVFFMRIDLGITGEIPLWIGNIAGLATLRLRSNFLVGHIPQQLCYLTDRSTKCDVFNVFPLLFGYDLIVTLLF